jgi:ribonuclease T2
MLIARLCGVFYLLLCGTALSLGDGCGLPQVPRMNTPRLLFLALALAATLSASASARQDTRDRGQAVGFDYFLLSLSIAPSFCASSPANAEKSECRSLSAADFRQTPLTIHGLWPNRAHVSTNQQPQDCDGPAFAISDTTQAQLRRYMPAGPGLARYEWRKHGTCSGMDPDRYFAAEAQLAAHANDTIGAAILAQGGTAVAIQALLQTIAARDPALAAAIIVDCRSPRGGGDPLVQEIRLTLSKDLRPIPASSVGMGQNSGCRGGVGQIPAPPR